MKDLKMYIIMMAFLLTGFTVFSQENEEEEETEEVVVEAVAETTAEGTESVQAIFDGFDGDSYSFNYKNEDDEEDTLFFNEVAPEVLKAHNLKDKKYIGKKFEVTFDFNYEYEVDEDGDKQEFVKRTITALKLLN